MIIVRSPLRITLGGGGTDLSSFYTKYEGFVIAATIDKYVYVTINRPFKKGVYIKYSEIESVEKVEHVKHKIIREALKMQNLNTPQIEITTMADIPAGTGLGSSGSFTTALLKGLYAHRRRTIHQEELAKLACEIEIEKLGEPIGKQDQYAASHGGLTCFEFHSDHNVTNYPLNIKIETIHNLEDNLLLFFTGFSRSASEILQDQQTRSLKQETGIIQNLLYVKKLAYMSKLALEEGDTQKFGEIMHEHWQNKKKRSKGMTNTDIDSYYELGLKNGAIGGKVVGAGGGGFLLFMASDRDKLRHVLSSVGLEEVRFKFDFEGTKVMYSA